MNQKLLSTRALSVYVARRSLALTNRLFFGGMFGLAILAITLILFVSGWWWILLIAVVLVCLIALAVSVIAKRFIKVIYRHPFSRTQRQELEAFTQKLLRLIDAQNRSQVTLAFVSLWDIVRYREPRTVMRIIDDSLSLTTDYQNLEKYFGDS